MFLSIKKKLKPSEIVFLYIPLTVSIYQNVYVHFCEHALPYRKYITSADLTKNTFCNQHISFTFKKQNTILKRSNCLINTFRLTNSRFA